MIGVHRALIGFLRDRVLGQSADPKRLAKEAAAAARTAFAALSDGLHTYAPARPRTADGM
jgi:hypothetical protein